MNATIIPTLGYTEARVAVEWLCAAFGFEKHLVVPGEDSATAHAQLRHGNGMIMLGSGGDGALQKTPQAVGGVVTQSPYIGVDDVDAHCARALDAGAQIVMPPEDQDDGGRLYFVPRSGRLPVEFRQLRSVGIGALACEPHC